MKSPPNRRKLTAGFVERVKPAERRVLVWDTQQPSLVLAVHPTGRKSWKLIYPFRRRVRWYDLGSGIGFADARKLAGRLMVQVRDGIDPQAQRQAERDTAISFDESL
jgi:hypothetical protein